MTNLNEPQWLPVLHLNGSGRKNLTEQWRKVYAAARELDRALAEATPHGRDFYPAGDDALRLARTHHDARRRAVQQITDDAETMLGHVMEY